MSCTCTQSRTECNPCPVCEPPDANCECLPSALDNFIDAFFGTVSKTVIDGKVEWTLPCDLAVGLEGNPRLPGEGLACYFLRLFGEGIVGLAGAPGLQGPPGLNGRHAWAVLAAPFVVPTDECPTVSFLVEDGTLLGEGTYLWIQGGSYYRVVAVSGNRVFAQLVARSSPAGTVVPVGTRVLVTGPRGPAGLQGSAGAPGAAGAPGPAGPAGPPGASAATTVQTPFTQPAPGANTGPLAFASGALIEAGQTVYVMGGGYYEVQSVVGNSVVLRNLFGQPFNAVAGTVISPAGTALAIVAGARGRSTFTQTTAAFTQPAPLSTVVVSVADGSAIAAGQHQFIVVGGVYRVESVAGNSLTLRNTTAPGNAAPGANIPAGSLVTPSAAPVAGDFDETRVVYVSKGGNDSNNGLATTRPKLTIASAIVQAASLIALGADNVKIRVLDAGTYIESVTLSEGMDLEASSAILIGVLTLADRCYVGLDLHYPSASSQDAVVKTGVSGRAFYRANTLDLRGVAGTFTGCRGLVNASNNSILFGEVGVLIVGENGSGIADTSAGNGHIHFWAPDIYLAGDNAIGVNAATAQSDYVGYTDHILNLGSPSNTIAFRLSNAGASIRATVTEVVADEVYNISAGSLYMQATRVVGARTGTPVWEWHNEAILPMSRGGVPAGGLTGQSLVKATDSDYDLTWASASVVAGRGIVVDGSDVHFAQNADYTANRIPFATSTTAIGFDANLTFDAAVPALIAGVSGGATKLLVNPSVTTPSLALWAVWTPTATSGNHWASNTQINADPSAATSGQYRGHECLAGNASGNNRDFSGQIAGGFFQGSLTGGGGGADLRGIIGRASHTGTATVTSAIGVEGGIHRITGAGTITTATCVLADSIRTHGTLSTCYGFRATHSGDAGTYYGLFLTTPTGTITNLYGIFQESATAWNTFRGQSVFGIGDPSLVARITSRHTHLTADLGWTVATVASAGRTGAGNMSCVGHYAVANTTGLGGAITGETSANVGVCAFYANMGHATATHSVNLLQGVRVLGQHSVGSGALTTMVGLDVSLGFFSAAGTTNAYQIYLRNRDGTNVTNLWGIYQEDAVARNYFAGQTLFGTTSPAIADVQLELYLQSTATSGNRVQTLNRLFLSAASASTSFNTAFNSSIRVTTNVNYSSAASDFGQTGIQGSVLNQGTGTIALGHAFRGYVEQSAAGTITEANCFFAHTFQSNSSAVIANLSGFRFRPLAGTGQVTNCFGLRIDPLIGTNRWGIYQEGAADRNYFAGQIKLGDNDTITANRPFDLTYTTTVTSGTVSSMWMGAELMPSSASATFHNGGYFYLRPGNAQNYSNPHYVLTGQYLHNGTGTVASARGTRGEIIKSSTGPITEAMALYGRIQNSNATGAITNGYALYLEASLVTGAITNRWGIYQAGTADLNRLNGLSQIQHYYGHMFKHEAATVIAIANTAVYYEIDSGWSTGEVSGVTFGGSHYLAPAVAGRYLVQWDLTLAVGSTNQSVRAALMVDGTAITSGGVQQTRNASSGEGHHLGGNTILSLAASQQVSLAVRNVTGTNNITVSFANLSLLRVGN
jgi:hypothetical protein